MPTHGARRPRAATCEEWDEDTQTILPDTQTSAYLTAKRSKSELVASKSGSSSTVHGDMDRANRKSPSSHKDGSVKKGKKSKALKVDTSFPERESRLYSSGPPAEYHQRSTSRPAAKPSVSKVEKPDKFVKPGAGECGTGDQNGHHRAAPPEPSTRSRDSSIPQSPRTSAKEPPRSALSATKPSEISATQARPVRSQSFRGPRPVTFHAGDEYHPLSGLATSAPAWNMLPPPVSPYPQTPFALTPTMTFLPSYADYQPSFQIPNNQMLHPIPRQRSPELYRGPSSRAPGTRGEPIIRQSGYFDSQPPLTRKMSRRDSDYSRESSRTRDEDTRRMPPPDLPTARRPSIAKAATSTSAISSTLTPASFARERMPKNPRPVPTQSLSKERRPDPPPTAYPPSSYQASSNDRPAPRKSASYAEPQRVTKVNTSAPKEDRRSALSNAERGEMEAEAYQRSRGSKPQPLTVDAVRNISRHSDGSQRSVNSSSRGSSGGKTKATGASTNDITMTVNGVTLGITADGGAENHSFKIQPKRNGGFNISVDEARPGPRQNMEMSLQKRGGSVRSSSKQSRQGSTSERETRWLREESLDGDQDQDRERDRDRHRASKESSRSRKTLFDDSSGYGLAYG